MAVEGEFPKADGDVLYASEVNLANPKLIGAINHNPELTNVSGTDFTILHTIPYSGTDTQIESWMNFRTLIQTRGATNDTHNHHVRVSGPGMNITAAVKSSTIAEVFAPIDHYMTSGAFTASGGNIGSNYVITLESKSNVNATSIIKNDFTVTGH